MVNAELTIWAMGGARSCGNDGWCFFKDIRLLQKNKKTESVFEKLAELVDDLRGGERADAEVGQPDVFAALREAHVQLPFVLLHERIERIDHPCALHVVAAGDFALVDFHDGQMPTVFWRMDHVEIALPFDEIVAGLRLIDPDRLMPRLLK